jgi:di/tricarboxylate transporter
MTLSAFFTLLLTMAASFMLITEMLRPDLVALIVMVLLGLFGIVTPQETFAGFSSTAVITILGISIVSIALHQTGVSHGLGKFMHRMGKQSEGKLILITMLVAACLSLFMNNIAAVGILLPAVMTLTRQSKVSPSRLLMPLAFGTVLGGMATLLTTSNIIVSGTLKDAGLKPFGLLDFLPIGIPIVIVGTIYMITVGRRLLPSGPGNAASQEDLLRFRLSNLYEIQKSLFIIEVLLECPLAGLSIAEGDWSKKINATIVGITSQQRTHLAPPPDQIIRQGDRLMVQGEIERECLSELGLRLIEDQTTPPSVSSETTILAEVLVAPHAELIGSSLRQVHFRERYSLNVLAIWRGRKPIQTHLSDLLLRFGDALLVQGSAEKIHQLDQDPDLVLLQEDPDAIQKPNKQYIAMVITLLVLGVAATGIMPVAILVMTAAVLLILTHCLELNDIYRGIEWKAIFLIAGMWPLSIAIRSTGLADMIIQAILNIFGNVTPLGLAALLLLVALVFTQLMSGQVAALVLAPLAMSAAQQVGVDPRGMAMAVALGCSLAFPTPYGHPVNIMVMGPGNYSFRDFLRVGGPLTVLIMIVILVGLHVFWGV